MKYARVYKITNPLGQVYIGSTTQQYLCNRLSAHKYAYLNKSAPSQRQSYTSFILFDNCECIDDCQITLLENVDAKDKYELQNRARWWIQNTDCVNVNIPNRGWREYYKDKHAEIMERISTPTACPCGYVGRRDAMNRHMKTGKHREWMKLCCYPDNAF